MDKAFFQLAVLNSNICTTHRMDFCEEIKEFKNNSEKQKQISSHKSHNRLEKIFNIYSTFYDKILKNSVTPIFTIQELRSYNQKDFIDYFKKIGYKLFLFPAYPNVVTEEIDLSDENSSDYNTKYKTKRFSFIHGIAVPESFSLVKEFTYYLCDFPSKFTLDSNWGHCGSRVCGGIEVITPTGIIFKIFTTQFGMDVNERLKSAELLSDIFSAEELPVILTGDFNSFANLDENVDQKGKEQIELLETTFRRVPILQGTFIGIRPVEKEKYCIDLETGFMANCLDHIFVKGHVDVINQGVIQPNDPEERLFPFSDHCMIWAYLNIA